MATHVDTTNPAIATAAKLRNLADLIEVHGLGDVAIGVETVVERLQALLVPERAEVATPAEEVAV